MSVLYLSKFQHHPSQSISLLLNKWVGFFIFLRWQVVVGINYFVIMEYAVLNLLPFGKETIGNSSRGKLPLC